MSLLSQAAAQADIQELAIPKEHLVTDGKTQARLKLNPATVAEYADLLGTCLEEGSPWPFPPVKVIRSESAHTHVGAHFDYVWDGFHRIAAARTVEWPHLIPALVRPGTQRDAILAAVGANADHGLRRTNADKRRAVTMLLMDKEWCQWSDRMIAEQAKVTHPFVAKIRADLYPPPSTTYPLPTQGEDGEEIAPTGNGYQSPAKRTGRDGRTINTSRIGNRRSDSDQNGKSAQTAQPIDWTGVARKFLVAYEDGQHRTVWTLAENQVHHANSPCHQAFVKRHPNCPDPKTTLRTALYGLRPELAPPAQQPAQATAPTPPTPPTARHISPQAKKLIGYLKTFSAWLSDDDEDVWLDSAKNTRMTDLRLLVKAMIQDLNE